MLAQAVMETEVSSQIGAAPYERGRTRERAQGYGREGHRAIVEHDLELAQHLVAVVDAAPDLERLAEVQLNVVCFRYLPPGSSDGPELNDLNRRIGEAARSPVQIPLVRRRVRHIP